MSVLKKLFRREACYYRPGDAYTAYDGAGDVCTSLPDSDVPKAAAIFSIAGAVLIALVGLYVYQFFKGRHHSNAESGGFALESNPMSSTYPSVPFEPHRPPFLGGDGTGKRNSRAYSERSLQALAALKDGGRRDSMMSTVSLDEPDKGQLSAGGSQGGRSRAGSSLRNVTNPDNQPSEKLIDDFASNRSGTPSRQVQVENNYIPTARSHTALTGQTSPGHHDGQDQDGYFTPNGGQQQGYPQQYYQAQEYHDDAGAYGNQNAYDQHAYDQNSYEQNAYGQPNAYDQHQQYQQQHRI